MGCWSCRHTINKQIQLRILFLSCVIDIYSKYAWVVWLKNIEGITITNAVQKILDDSGRKPYKIWVDQDNKFYNGSIKSWQHDNGIVDYNDKDPIFNVGDHVRILKYKNVSAKGYTWNWLEDVFVFKKVKNTVPWTYVISDLNSEEIVGTFYDN